MVFDTLRRKIVKKSCLRRYCFFSFHKGESDCKFVPEYKLSKKNQSLVTFVSSEVLHFSFFFYKISLGRITVEKFACGAIGFVTFGHDYVTIILLVICLTKKKSHPLFQYLDQTRRYSGPI